MSGLAQPLLGRDAEFRRLESALARAGEGSPSIVVCSGEAGIGKTWLASAFRAQAAAAGALVGSGAALQLAGAPPFLPWSTALRQVAPAAAEALDADRVDQPSARIRVGRFDAVVAGVRQAARGPLALVLDDMHWADDASLLLLRHVARTVSTECLLVLVLTRGGDSRDELWSTVLRAPSVTMLPLPPLAGTSVREQVAALTGRVPSDRELAQLMRLTGGNPFFVAEVAAAWQREGWDARRFVSGPAVAGAITERLAALTAGDREVVDAAAVVGPLADAPLVARVARRGLAAATVALGAGVTAGLLRRVGGERYTFVHELVREAVLAGMPVTALVTLHRRAAEILETGRLDPGDATVFAVAAHWLAVAAEVEPDREPAVAVRAADAASIAAAEAMRRWAYEDALDLLDRALRLSAIRCHTSGAGGSEGAEAARLRRCRLLLQRAAAADVVGALALGVGDCTEAADLATAAGRPDLVVEAGLALRPIGRPDVNAAIRALAERALQTSPPPATRARLIARVVESLAFTVDAADATSLSAAAVEAAEQAGDEAALAAALCARRVVVAGPDSLTARAELADALLGSARRGRDADVELTGWLVAADAAFERGDLGRVEVCAAAAERSAASLGGPTARFQVLHTRAALAQARGEFTDARALTDEAFRLMEVTDQPARFHTRAGVLGFIGRHQGTGLAVISNEDNVTSSGASREPIVLLAAAHALVCDGQLVSARALRATLGPPSQWRVPPHVQLLCWSLGIAVDTALGDRTTLVALIEALTPYRDHHAVSGMSAVAYFGPVRLWLGVAERHLERFPAAVDHLTAAHEACVRAGAAAFGVEAQTELAAVLVARGVSGDTGRADALLAEAATEADRLGMTRYAPVVAALRRQLSGSGTVLTPREIDVARLVARGMTNRQIAARLTLSERTAQNHVQHILTKLQLSNRSQIAVWLTRMSNGS